jgi:hypothetical protein
MGMNVTDDVTIGTTGMARDFSSDAAINRLRSLGYEEVGGVGEVTFKNVPLREQASSYVINVLGDDKRERAERWIATNKQNLIEKEALKNMVLLNVDPGKFEKSLLARGVEVLAEESLPSYVSVDKAIGFTSDRKLIDAALPLLQEEGIELTKEQEQNLKRTFGEEATEATTGMVPVIAKLALINSIAGPVRTISGFGTLVDRLSKSKSLVDKGIALFLDASFEEAQMQAAGFDPGTGFGFNVAGKLFKGVGLDKFPIRGKGEMARFNKSADALWNHAIKGATSSEFASNVEAVIKDFEGGETWKNFSDENYSDLSDVTKRMLVNGIAFGVLGARDLGFFVKKGKSGFNISNMEKARDEAQRKGYKEEADMLTKYINEYYAGKPGKAQPASYNDMKLFVENVPENESRRFTVSSLEEVPVEFRDRAKKNESVETEVDRTFLGIPLGKKRVNSGESYSYEITGKEIREVFNKKKEGKTETEFEEEFDMSQKAEEPPVSEEVTETETTVTEPTGDIVPAKQKGRLTKFSTPQDGIVGEVTYEDGTKKELTQEEYDALEKQEGLFDVETGTQPVAETPVEETVSAPTEVAEEAAPVELKEGEIDITTVFKNPVEKNNEQAVAASNEFKDKAGEYDEGVNDPKFKEENTTVEEISVDDIIPTQERLFEKNLKSPSEGEPLVMKIGDKYYVEDGHHRIGNEINADKQTVSVRIYESDKAKQDAVQKQATGKVPVQPESKAGEKVEEGKPKTEAEKPTQEGKEVLSEEDAKSEEKVNKKIEEGSGEKDLVKEVVKSTVTKDERKKVAEEEGIDESEVDEKIEEEVKNQINDKSEKEPKTLLQRIASRIRKAIMSLLIVANAFNISGVKAPTTKSKAYDNIKVENLQSFDKMYMDQEAVNKKNNIDIIRKSQANKNENYIILDKSTGSAHLFKGEELITSYQIGVGEKSGDIQTRVKSIYLNDKTGKEVPISVATTERNGVKYLKPGFSSRTNWNDGTKTTGAGIFKISEKTSYIGKMAFALLNEQGISTEMMLHEVTTPVRARLMSDGNPDNNRITNGCVNFMYGDTKDLEKRGVGAGAMVYVLPDNPNNVYKLIDGELRFESEDTKVNRTTAYTKPFQSQPITIKAKGQVSQQAKEFLVTVADVKSEIMEMYPTISNDEYNRMAKIAYGIFGQESSFGTYGGPRGKAGFIKDIGQVALEKVGVDEVNVFGKLFKSSDPSVGLTQTRLSSIPENVRKKFGINESKDLLNNEKSAIATMAAMVNMYVNEIEPTGMGGEMENIIPLGWSNDRTSSSPFVKALKGDESQYKNKYVDNVRKASDQLEVYIGDNPIEKPVEKKDSTEGEAPIGLMALPFLFAGRGRKRRRKPLEDTDADKVVTDWMEDVQKIYDAQKTKDKQEAVNEAATNLALSGRLNEIAPDQRLKVLEDIAKQTAAMDEKKSVSITSELQGLTLKEQFKQGFEEYVSAMKQKESDRKEKAKESAQKKIDAEKEKVSKLKEKAKEAKEEAKQGFEEYLDARKRKEAERIQKIETKLRERIDKLKEKAKEAVQNAKDDVAARKIFNEIIKAEMNELGLGTLKQSEVTRLLSMAKNADKKKVEELIENGINLMVKAAKKNLKTAAEASKKKLVERIKKGDFGTTDQKAIAIANIPVENIPVERLQQYYDLLDNLVSLKGKVSARDLNKLSEFIDSISEEIENKIGGVETLAELYDVFDSERKIESESQEYTEAKKLKKDERNARQQGLINRIEGKAKEEFKSFLEELGMPTEITDFANNEFDAIVKEYKRQNTEKGKPLTASQKIGKIKEKRQQAIDNFNNLYPIEKGVRGIDVSLYKNNEVLAEAAAFFNKLGNNQLKDLLPSEINALPLIYENMNFGLMTSSVFRIMSRIKGSMTVDQMSESSNQFSRMLATSPKDLPGDVKTMAEDFTLPLYNLVKPETPTSVSIKDAKELGRRMLAEQTPYIKYLMKGIKGDPVYEMLNGLTGGMTSASSMVTDAKRKTYDLFMGMKGLPLENNIMISTFHRIREHQALKGETDITIRRPIEYVDAKIESARTDNQGVYDLMVGIKDKYFDKNGDPKIDNLTGESLIEKEINKRGGKELIDFMDKMNEVTREMGRTIAVIRGIPYKEIDLYGASRAEHGNDLSEKMSKITAGKTLSSVKSGAVLSRTGNKNKTFDAVGDFLSSFDNTVHEYYLTEPLSTISNFVSIANKTGNVNLARYANAIKDYVSGSIESQIKTNYSDGGFLVSLMNDIISTRKSGAVFGLGIKPFAETFSQMNKILLIPEARKSFITGIQILRGAGDGGLNFKKAFEFMKAIQSTHQNRAGALNAEVYYQPGYFERKMKSETGNRYNIYNKVRPLLKPTKSIKRGLQRAAEISQMAPDAFGVIQVNIGAFAEKFKELTGNYPDIDKIIEDKQYRAENADAIRKARAYADKLTSSTAAPSSMAEVSKAGYLLPPLRMGYVKKEPGKSQNLFILDTYSGSEKRTLLTNLKELRDSLMKPFITKGMSESWTGSDKKTSDVLQEITGRSMASVSYQVYRAVGFAVLGILISMIESSLFGTDEDELDLSESFDEGVKRGALDQSLLPLLGNASWVTRLMILGGIAVAARYTEGELEEGEESYSEDFKEAMYVPDLNRYGNIPLAVSKLGFEGQVAADALELAIMADNLDDFDEKEGIKLGFLLSRNSAPMPQEASRLMRIVRTMEKVENLNYLMYGNKSSYLSNAKIRGIYRLYENLEFDKSVLPPTIRDKESITDKDGNTIKYEIDKDKLNGLYNERGRIMSNIMNEKWMAAFMGASDNDKKKMLKEIYGVINSSEDYQKIKDTYFIKRGKRVN